jgi:hypothetical protein
MPAMLVETAFLSKVAGIAGTCADGGPCLAREAAGVPRQGLPPTLATRLAAARAAYRVPGGGWLAK